MSPKLPRISPDQLVRALHRAGWRDLRQSGSHLHLTHPDQPGKVLTVAVHSGKDVPVGTLRAILNQAGLTPDEFRALL